MTDQVYEYLRNKSAWTPLSSISVSEMAVHFDASRDAILLALSVLEAQGRVVTVTSVRVVELSA